MGVFCWARGADAEFEGIKVISDLLEFGLSFFWVRSVGFLLLFGFLGTGDSCFAEGGFEGF